MVLWMLVRLRQDIGNRRIFCSADSHMIIWFRVLSTKVQLTLFIAMDLSEEEQSNDGERWVQPESPVLTTSAVPLVFNQGHFPSVVAYVPSGGSEHIFSVLGILYDRLKDITTSESASNLLRNFKQIAIKFGIKEQLHLRGSVSRCGVGSESWVIFSFLSYETNTIWLFQCWKCADLTFAEFEGVVL